MTHIIGTALLVSVIFASTSHSDTPAPTLSEFEKQIAMESAKAGQLQPAFPDQPSQLTLYRMEEESNRVLLALSMTIAGLLSLFLVLSYLKNREAPPDTIVVGSGLVLVIFATILVVILVKVDEQLTAATGILGAIAGYLFGKTTAAINVQATKASSATHG